jgi:hypothetical protein
MGNFFTSTQIYLAKNNLLIYLAKKCKKQVFLSNSYESTVSLHIEIFRRLYNGWLLPQKRMNKEIKPHKVAQAESQNAENHLHQHNCYRQRLCDTGSI